jgi:alanyl-tRNA synthetase
VLLLDQRGTGRSTPLTRLTVEGWSDAEIAAYLRLMRADAIVRDVAAIAGGRGGGKPHMAQAGIPDASRIEAALNEAPKLVAALLANA